MARSTRVSSTRTAAGSKSNKNIFGTDRRIKLGIWGLGRGMSFYKACESLNIDVVAGCDFNPVLRDNFVRANPGAYVTADADEFLRHDFDAVLLATFCPGHAPDAIRCIKAGKHVLSEVTAFFNIAQGVELVEAVEKSGLVYNLAENYPFTAANSWLTRRWSEGLFGDLLYAEFEYVHECRSLAYTYGDGNPVQPGHTIHSWRSWLNFHYYCTHSLGPIMVITGLRPERVVSLPSSPCIAGMPSLSGIGGAAPSLIKMSNGAVVRNLMAGSPSDTHVQRIWGTRGAAQINVGSPLSVRLGGTGHSPMIDVTPKWDDLGELAAKMGHGGGDFWVLYYFARQILTGKPGPFDVYGAADVTLPGILALRSCLRDGEPQAVPDFRDAKQREAYRNDTWEQDRLNPKTWAFPAKADPKITDGFTTLMKDLISVAPVYRAYADWTKITEDVQDTSKIARVVEKYIQTYPQLVKVYKQAHDIIKAYPKSNAARPIKELLELGGDEVASSKATLAQAKKILVKLNKGGASAQIVSDFACSALQPLKGSVDHAKLPAASMRYSTADYRGDAGYCDIRGFHNRKPGLLYVRGRINVSAAGKGTIFYCADGPFRAWLNGKPLSTDLKAHGPVVPARYKAPVQWKKGINDIIFALDTKDLPWGVMASAIIGGK